MTSPRPFARPTLAKMLRIIQASDAQKHKALALLITRAYDELQEPPDETTR